MDVVLVTATAVVVLNNAGIIVMNGNGGENPQWRSL